MEKVIRYILAIVIGFFTLGVIVLIGETIGHKMYPLPPNLDTENTEAMTVAMQRAPTGALVAVLIAWALGAFVGAWWRPDSRLNTRLLWDWRSALSALPWPWRP